MCLWPGHVASCSCVLLEDRALSHLSHDAQKLKFLELVEPGPDLQDDDLLPIFET